MADANAWQKHACRTSNTVVGFMLSTKGEQAMFGVMGL